MRIVLGILLAIVILAVLALGFVYAGVYDVAATRPHSTLVRRTLETLRARSVAVRADEVPEPPPVDAETLAHGFEHYHAMCVACHGAPGRERGEFGQGLSPTPPLLHEDAEDLSAREIFWIVKNGIKVAAMPAFGPTHSDAEIWGIVAVVQRLPEMTPEAYRSALPAAAAADSLAAPTGHAHPPGTPEHQD